MKKTTYQKTGSKSLKLFLSILKILVFRSEKNQILNDFREDYQRVSTESGERAARRWGIEQLAISIFPFLGARLRGEGKKASIDLKTALRGLSRRKTLSFINIGGMALGMAACLMLVHNISYETSFDGFHEKVENIYRLKMAEWAGSHGPAGRTARDAFPEVLDYVKINPIFANGIFARGDIRFKENRVYFANAAFLTVFSFELLKGDPRTALKEINTVVLTRTAAHRYFGEEDPMGKTLTFAGRKDYTVTGVLRDVPDNSHMVFDILVSMPSLQGDWAETSWYYSSFHTYLLLRPGTDPGIFEKKLQDFFKKLETQMAREQHSGLDYRLQPLTSIHLTSHHEFELKENGDIRAVAVLVLIAVLILFSAWINTMNLCTARSLERAREIAIRKIVGALRVDVFRQFLIEAQLFNTLAVCLAFLFIALAAPVYFQVTGIPSTSAPWLCGGFGITAVFLLFFGSLASGLYPSLVLSSFKPVTALQGKQTDRPGGSFFRKGLLVFQFGVAIVLIAVTAAVYRQIGFMKNQDLGLNIDRTLVIKAPELYENTAFENRLTRMRSFKTEIGKLPDVEDSAASNFVPGEYVMDIHGVRLETAPERPERETHILAIDPDFLSYYGIELLAGRNFENNASAEKDKVILNRALVEGLGIPDIESAVGRKLLTENGTMEIIGVTRSFHQQSLKHDYEPILMLNRAAAGGCVSMRINTGHIPETLASVRAVWEEVYPGNPFHYFFLRDSIARQYITDLRFGQVAGLFAILAVAISCLGLFGLSSLNVSGRIKEIGIRKTMGAGYLQICSVLLRDFFKLIALAALIAVPTAFLLFRKWLSQYAFRIEPGWWFPVVPVALILTIAFLTVIGQVSRAAQANPADSLRCE